MRALLLILALWGVLSVVTALMFGALFGGRLEK